LENRPTCKKWAIRVEPQIVDENNNKQNEEYTDEEE